jgi:hypothetical protein
MVNSVTDSFLLLSEKENVRMAWPFLTRKLVVVVVGVSICGLALSTLRVSNVRSSSFVLKQNTIGKSLSTFNEDRTDTMNASNKTAAQNVIFTAMITNSTTTTTNIAYANTSMRINTEKIVQAPQDNLFNFSPPFPNIKIQYPVFVASLYKCGTTSVHSYFLCGKQRSIHHHHGESYQLGICLMENMNVSKYQ